MRKWSVATSHPIEVPQSFEAKDVGHLMRLLQEFAEKLDRTAQLAFGQLNFTVTRRGPYEQLKAYFFNRHGKRSRFMRLEEQDLGNITLYIAAAAHDSYADNIIAVGYTADEAEQKLQLLLAEQDETNWYILDDVDTQEIPYYAPSS